jgi:hypothetical protein
VEGEQNAKKRAAHPAVVLDRKNGFVLFVYEQSAGV